jgi:hypothetical protein
MVRMSEKKRRLVSLIALGLFITIVGLANAANAGGPGTPLEETLLQIQLRQAANR